MHTLKFFSYLIAIAFLACNQTGNESQGTEKDTAAAANEDGSVAALTT
jgi:hypothetical protein